MAIHHVHLLETLRAMLVTLDVTHN